MKKKRNASKSRSESRRDFIKKGAIAATAVMAGCSPKVGEEVAEKATKTAPATGAVLGANDRLVVGFIGVGGQGFHSHVQNVLNLDNNGGKRHDLEFNAVGVAGCDVFSKRRDRVLEAMKASHSDRGFQGYEVAAYEDYRELLDRQDIDAVFIGTVDHWHTQIAVDAMQAGKHVYCEKPMTRYLTEGFQVYDAVKESGLKFQIGSQFCTEGKWHKAAEMIQAGKIGPLVLCQDSYMRNTPDGEWNYYGIEPELEHGKTIDWNKWLGPISEREFNPEHYHRWRKYYPYCAGLLGDLLAHRIHPLIIATGNPEFPTRVACMGNKQIGDAQMGPEDRDVTTVTQVMAEFPSGLNMVVTSSSVNEQGLGQVFRGQEATLYFSGNTLELRPERPFADLVDQERIDNIEPGPTIPHHIENFFDAIRDDKETNGNIEVAIRAQTIISMAEMSERLGLMLYFDEATRSLSTGTGQKVDPITYGTLELS